MLVPPAKDVPLPVRIYNPRFEAIHGLSIALTSEYPIVQVPAGHFTIGTLGSGEIRDLSQELRAKFTSGAGYLNRARLQLALTLGAERKMHDIDVWVIPEIVPAPAAVEVLDGRTLTFSVFRQKGNQGGGGSISRRVTEGRGNGNGVLEPGEEATIWVKMTQGMDPFDKHNWHRCRVLADSRWLSEAALIEEPKQLEWTGAQNRSSLVRLDARTPRGTKIPLLLENETWSFAYTPDVRYGKQPLYQAFQRHRRHLHAYTLLVP